MRRAVLLREDALAPQVPVRAKRRGKPDGHRNLSLAPKDRKLFFERKELVDWLSEVLTPAEIRRLNAFLDE